MIKYNLNNINDWNFGEDNIIKVYRNNAIVFYKFDSETQEFKVCYAVVADITQYTDREFEDVYNLADDKWYKLNNLNQYEQYGIYGSGRTITTYEGKLTVDEEVTPPSTTATCEFIYSGGSWVNVGEVSGSSRVPQGYTEVEYVENTSSAYINTNLVLLENIGDSFEIKVKTYFTPYGRDFEYLFGTEQTSAPYTGIQLRYYQRNLQFSSDSNVVWTHIDNGDGTSGVTASCSSINATNGGNPLTLFCGLWSTGPWRFGRGKIYSFTVTKNNSIVRNLVPCKRNNDNMVGVYDLANDVFYYPPNYSSYQLIAGAETGSTVYPMYYDEKSDPLDNISFSSMTEAEEYAYNNCVYDGMKATIAGEKYYFDSEDENGWVKQLLPYDAEIEYLESTGTQYINTNTYITNVSNFEVGYELVSGNTEEVQWGWAHQNAINGAWVTVDLLNAVAFFGRWGTSSTDPTYKVIIPSSSISSVENTIVYKSNSGVTVNGTFYSKTLSLTTTDNITTVPLYFFARYDFYRRGLEYSTNAKFKSFYLKQNDVLVLDMIPVRVGQVGYMYDRVSGELFGNAGTSNFVLGADKN